MKKCPFCTEKIRNEATICQSCPRKSACSENFLRLLLVVLWLALVAPGHSQSAAPPPPQSQQNQESLGVAARKARATKGKFEPGKVYTEEDFAVLRSDSVSIVGQEIPTAPASPEKKNSETKRKASHAAESERDKEEYWRGRARELQEQMAAVDLKIKKVKDEIKTYGSSGFDVTSGLYQNIIYVDDRISTPRGAGEAKRRTGEAV